MYEEHVRASRGWGIGERKRDKKTGRRSRKNGRGVQDTDYTRAPPGCCELMGDDETDPKGVACSRHSVPVFFFFFFFLLQFLIFARVCSNISQGAMIKRIVGRREREGGNDRAWKCVYLNERGQGEEKLAREIRERAGKRVSKAKERKEEKKRRRGKKKSIRAPLSAILGEKRVNLPRWGTRAKKKGGRVQPARTFEFSAKQSNGLKKKKKLQRWDDKEDTRGV